MVFVSNSSIVKHPNKSFFNPYKYILTSFTHTSIYCFCISTFIRLTFKIYIFTGSNESIARACASALRGLTSDDDTDNLIRIMHDGGIQAVLRLSTSTKDVVTRRNCSLAMRNILSHTETLEELLNNPEMSSICNDMYDALYELLSTPRDVDVVRYTCLSMYNLSCTTSGASRLRLVSNNLVARLVEMIDAWNLKKEILPMDVR